MGKKFQIFGRKNFSIELGTSNGIEFFLNRRQGNLGRVKKEVFERRNQNEIFFSKVGNLCEKFIEDMNFDKESKLYL